MSWTLYIHEDWFRAWFWLLAKLHLWTPRYDREAPKPERKRQRAQVTLGPVVAKIQSPPLDDYYNGCVHTSDAAAQIGAYAYDYHNDIYLLTSGRMTGTEFRRRQGLGELPPLRGVPPIPINMELR